MGILPLGPLEAMVLRGNGPLGNQGVFLREHVHVPLFPRNGRAAREKENLSDSKATTTNIKGEFAGNGDSLGLMSSFPPSNSSNKDAQRSSQRVIVKVSVMVLAREPYWPETPLKCFVLPAAKRLGIAKQIGWHSLSVERSRRC